MNTNIFANFICLHVNYYIDICEFRRYLTCWYNKKKEKSDETNHIPISILLNLSKTYEKLIYNHLYDYFDNIVLPSQCGFRKGYSFQHCLLAMLENFKKSADDLNEFRALLTNLTKAFDYIDHKILTAKLFWYRVSLSALNLIHSYLTNKTQRIKINNIFSRRSSTEYHAPKV